MITSIDPENVKGRAPDAHLPPLNYDSSDCYEYTSYTHSPLSTISHLLKRWRGERFYFIFFLGFQSMYEE